MNVLEAPPRTAPEPHGLACERIGAVLPMAGFPVERAQTLQEIVRSESLGDVDHELAVIGRPSAQRQSGKGLSPHRARQLASRTREDHAGVSRHETRCDAVLISLS